MNGVENIRREFMNMSDIQKMTVELFGTDDLSMISKPNIVRVAYFYKMACKEIQKELTSQKSTQSE